MVLCLNKISLNRISFYLLVSLCIFGPSIHASEKDPTMPSTYFQSENKPSTNMDILVIRREFPKTL